MSRLRFRTRKESHPINRDSSLQASNLKMAELYPTTTSKKSLPSIWFSDLEEECKSLSRPSLVKLLPSMLNHPTPLITSRLKSKTKKESHPINKDSSLLENSWKMVEPSLTTIFKRNQLFIWCLDSEEVCKSSSRLWLERPLLLMLNLLTLLIMLRPKFRTRKESHPINRDLSSQESNSKMEEHYQTTTFKKNLLSIWSSDWEVVCRSLWKLLLERP